MINENHIRGSKKKNLYIATSPLLPLRPVQETIFSNIIIFLKNLWILLSQALIPHCLSDIMTPTNIFQNLDWRRKHCKTCSKKFFYFQNTFATILASTKPVRKCAVDVYFTLLGYRFIFATCKKKNQSGQGKFIKSKKIKDIFVKNRPSERWFKNIVSGGQHHEVMFTYNRALWCDLDVANIVVAILFLQAVWLEKYFWSLACMTA